MEAEARREVLTRTSVRETKSHPGRKPLPESLPRVTRVIACSERTRASCGEETAVIGYDQSEHLDVEPARYFVRVAKREKRACPALFERDGCAVGRAHRGKRISQRRGGDHHGDREVLRSHAAVPASGDAGAGVRRWMVG